MKLLDNVVIFAISDSKSAIAILGLIVAAVYAFTFLIGVLLIIKLIG